MQSLAIGVNPQSELDHTRRQAIDHEQVARSAGRSSGRHDQFAASASALRHLTQKKTGNLLRRAAASPGAVAAQRIRFWGTNNRCRDAAARQSAV